MPEELLKVEGLSKYYPVHGGLFLTKIGDVKAVDQVSFSISPGDTMGCIGESGSGKSVLLNLLVQMEKPTTGSIRFLGQELKNMSADQLREFHRQVSMVFQDPVGSLHPRMTVGQQIGDPLLIHNLVGRRNLKDKVAQLLTAVGLDPEMAERYPHQFSGGQRQRIGIARALALTPKLILMDEPVSALDVSLAAQVINMLLDLQEEFHLTYFIIAHDMAVLRQICTKVGIMYAGRFVEYGSSEMIYSSPLHPYTRALLDAAPSLMRNLREEKSTILPGESPDLSRLPKGCYFHPRCAYAQDICRQAPPPPKQTESGHFVECHVFP